MNTSKLDEIQAFIDEKQAERKNKIEMMRTLIERAKKEKSEAETESRERFEDLDIDGYQAAMKRIETAKDEISMYESKIKEVENAPLMTKDQYRTYADEITSLINSMNKEAAGKILKVLNAQLLPYKADISGAISRANDQLDIMIHDLLRLKDGTPEFANTKVKYSDYSISNLIGSLEKSVSNMSIFKDEA